MCPTTGFCRLCLCSSTEIKELVNENGQYNNIYEIAAKYFDPMLLTTAICANCWQQIYEFYEFQQSVLKAQTGLGNVGNNDPIVKLEIMLVDEQEENKEDPKEDLNISISNSIDYSNAFDSEVEIPIMEEKDNKGDLKEGLIISMSNSIDLMDSNPFESEDEIPLGEYSIKKIQEFENLRLKETKKYIKKSNNSPSVKNSKYDTVISEEFSFSCIFCDKKCKDAECLRRHTTTHTGKYPYQCPYCETKFNGRKNISLHVKRFHPHKHASFNVRKLKSLNLKIEDTKETVQAKFKCSLCDTKFTSSHSLRNHIKYTHNRDANCAQCPHCLSKLSRPNNLRRHIKLLHPEKCVEPEKKNEPKVDLNLIGQDLNSTEKHTPNYDDYDAFIAKWKPDLECPLCKSLFKNFGLLRVHFRLKHPENKCHITCCKYKIKSSIRLVDHLRLHLDPSSFKCRICGRCAPDSVALTLHMRRHTEEKPFQCEVCQKRFRHQSKFLIHSGYHSTEKNEFCKICNKGFANKDILRKHVNNMHNPKAKHLCDQCGKHCDNDSALKEHFCMHAGVNNPKWRCDKCGIQLTSRSTLRSHKNMCYIDSKAIYVCSECSQHFSSKSSFNQHKETVHGGVCKPKFICIVCDKELSSLTSYRTHAAIHTGDSKYQCPHCPIILKQKKNFGRHLKMLHPLEFAQMKQCKRSNVDLNLEDQNIII